MPEYKGRVALAHPCTNREGLPMQGRNTTHPEDVWKRLDFCEKDLPIRNYTLVTSKLEEEKLLIRKA